MNKSNVKTIIKNHLDRNRYDGLFNKRLGCWCALGDNDFLTCEDIPEDCQPGYKYFCENCKEECCYGDFPNYHPDPMFCIKEREDADEQA